MLISLDTETTGVDFYHSARPFFVTVCKEDGTQLHWEWEVDPLTRIPNLVGSDLEEIQNEIDEADTIVLQNAKFDVTALLSIYPTLNWDWLKVKDTLYAGHLLASNHPHDLTSMAIEYLGVDIQKYEDALEEAVQECRRFCRSMKYGLEKWAIAKKGNEDMPSAKEKTWKFDSWLPKAICKYLELDEEHPWQTVLSEYSNMDSAVTLSLWQVQEKEIERRGLKEILDSRLKLMPITLDMESRGVTGNIKTAHRVKEEFRRESEMKGSICRNIARSYNYDLEMPKGGNNKSLREFCFSTSALNLPKRRVSEKTGEPSLDKNTLEWYSLFLSESSKQRSFVNALLSKRKRDTAIRYLDGYERFWIPLDKALEYFRLHPSVNPTGTDTLRWSFHNPNEANISKQPGFNLRQCFGPTPDREWYSFDAQNLELRIPTYEADEKELIDVFDHPNRSPYYGSYHLVVFDTLYPELFAKHGKECKTLYEATFYQWIKNGNFAIIYGAQESTADATYKVKGAYQKIYRRFPKIAALSQRYQSMAQRNGYVETMINKRRGGKRGYPLLCSRSSDGYIIPTTPFNYHVSGTAMDWMDEAMIKVYNQLQEWRDSPTQFDGFITLQVHDELDLDFPRRSDPIKDPKGSNLTRVLRVKELMESCGNDIGVPTPVTVEYHSEHWAEGVAISA